MQQEIGWLKTENQNKSAEITRLREKIESQDESIDQKITKEVEKKMKEFLKGDHSNFSSGKARQKRPYRLLPITKKGPGDKKNNQGEIISSNQPRRFYGPPTSCSDLSLLGYTLNGFYLVKPNSNSNDAKVEAVSCSFEQPPGSINSISKVEKRVGHLTLLDNSNNNSKPASAGTGIHFQVQRNKDFEFGANAIIQFDLIRLNLGQGFNETSGIFIAPKSGIYQFNFKGIIQGGHSLANRFSHLAIYLNDVVVANTFIMGSNTNTANAITEGTFKLKRGDKIYLKSDVAPVMGVRKLFGNSIASFSGSLMEELD